MFAIQQCNNDKHKICASPKTNANERVLWYYTYIHVHVGSIEGDILMNEIYLIHTSTYIVYTVHVHVMFKDDVIVLTGN